MNAQGASGSTRLWNRDFILILLVCAFASFTNNVFMIILPVYILDIGGSNTVTGFMMTGLTIAGIVTRLLFGPLIDRWGRKKMLLLGSGLYALNALAYCFVSGIPGVVFLRVLNGVTQGIFFPVPPTIVADVTPEDRLVDGMGFFGVSSSVIFAVTPAIGLAIYQGFGAVPLFVVSFVFAAAALVFALLIREHYTPSSVIRKTEIAVSTTGSGVVSSEKGRPSEGKRTPKWALLIEAAALLPSFVVFFLYMGNSSVTNFLTACGLERGIERISVFFIVHNLTMVIVRVLTGRLTKYFEVSRLTLMGVLASAASYVMISFADSLWLMLASGVVMGIGITLTTQLLQVKILTDAEQNRRGVANSTFMLLGDIGVGAGAAVCGAVAEGSGYTLMFLVAAAATLAGAVVQYASARPRRE